MAHINDIESIDISTVSWILIIEKDVSTLLDFTPMHPENIPNNIPVYFPVSGIQQILPKINSRKRYPHHSKPHLNQEDPKNHMGLTKTGKRLPRYLHSSLPPPPLSHKHHEINPTTNLRPHGLRPRRHRHNVNVQIRLLATRPRKRHAQRALTALAGSPKG